MTQNAKRPLRFHIIGSVGSGKTTLARRLSQDLKIPYYELDNVVWKRSTPKDIKRTKEERDEMFLLKNKRIQIKPKVSQIDQAPSLSRKSSPILPLRGLYVRYLELAFTSVAVLVLTPSTMYFRRKR